MDDNTALIIAMFVCAGFGVGVARALLANNTHTLNVNVSVSNPPDIKSAKNTLKELGYSASEADEYIAAALVLHPSLTDADDIVQASLEQIDV